MDAMEYFVTLSTKREIVNDSYAERMLGRDWQSYHLITIVKLLKHSMQKISYSLITKF